VFFLQEKLLFKIFNMAEVEIETPSPQVVKIIFLNPPINPFFTEFLEFIFQLKNDNLNEESAEIEKNVASSEENSDSRAESPTPSEELAPEMLIKHPLQVKKNLKIWKSAGLRPVIKLAICCRRRPAAAGYKASKYADCCRFQSLPALTSLSTNCCRP
jgi:hypothetical protein